MVASEDVLNIRDDLKNFLQQTDESDAIHDVVFRISKETFPAHRFIVADASRKLQNLFGNERMVDLPEVAPEMFREVLNFIYSGQCDLTTGGECPEALKYNKPEDPVKLLQETAKKLGVGDLEKALDCFYYNNGFVNEKSDRVCLAEKKWPTHKDFSCYHDVNVKSNDGRVVKAHKCILAARLEYFNNLLSGRWNEVN